MSRKLAFASILALSLLGAACSRGGGGSGGGSTTPALTGQQVALSTGAAIVSADATVSDPSSAADRTRLGIPAFGRSYTLTTPAGLPIDLSFTTTSRLGGRLLSDGSVIVRIALGGRTGKAAQDLEAAGISVRGGNLIDRGAWVETRGDGFVRLLLTGAVARDEVLFVEREDGSGGKSHAVISLAIGPRSVINPVFEAATGYPGLGPTTNLLSSSAPVFGLPAIAANGDRVSVVCYDSTTTAATGSAECVYPGVTRLQRRLQLDPATGAATMGETVAAGHDASSWRDTEISGLFNVIAIAQSGAEGLPVSISVDRGATFAQTIDVAPGSVTRLARVTVGPDYTAGVLYWDFGQNASVAKLVLCEGVPAGYDANNSPTSYTFAAPTTLLTTDATSVPLVPDVKYTTCGDAFVAYGYSERNPTTGSTWTYVGTFRRYAGAATFTGPLVIDQTETIAFDPSLAVVGCGAIAQVYVGYESQTGVRIRRSQDGAQSFPDVVRFGTRSAYGPRLFARPTTGGGTNVDCLFLDLGDDGFGTELRMFHSDAGFANASIYRLIQAKQVATASGPTRVEAMGWFGFDAVELNGKIYAAAHVQRTEFFLPLGAPGGGLGMLTPTAAPAPRVLYPGMTQPVPAFDPDATHKLSVLEIN